MSEDKAKKKLKNFFDKNASLAKRWKSLTSYIQKAIPEELPKFFNENFYMIYGVFLETFQAHEANCRKGKHSNSELNDLILVLKNILVHLSELIRKKWQTRSIATVLEKILYKENKIQIRLEGMELILIFLEAVQVLEPSQTDLFATAIDLAPLCVDRNANCKLRYTAISAPDKLSVLLPSSQQSNIENSTKLFEFLLDYLSGVQPNVFEFWFDLLKKHYLADFYPEISVKLRILDDGSVGFLSHCPYTIQAALTPRLEQWLKKESTATYLFSMEENIQLLLEIFRQSCRMPLSFESTITSTISIFQQLFFGPKLIPEIERRAIDFRQFFFHQVVTVFSISPEDQRQKHLQLCSHVVGIFKQIFTSMYEKFPFETKECLLQTLLNTTIEVCRNANLVDSMPSMLDTVFFIWIHTKRNTPQMWKLLQDRISSVLHVKEPIRQTKNKLLQLTYLIIDMIYPRKQKKKAREIEGSEKAKKELPNSISPDSRASIAKIPIDQSLLSLSWTVDELLYVWNQMLLIFRNVNAIKDASVHAESLKVLLDIIDVLLQAEEVPFSHLMDPNSHPQLCLINIFGPWLFEALSLPEAYIKGKEIAAEALCKLIIRHNVESPSLDLLSHFYGVVFNCFRDHPNSIVSWSILLNSSNIFNISPQGCNILIPHYISEIKRVLRGQGAPNDVKTKCILIITSLICYPNHMDSLSCPIDFNPRGNEYNFQNQLKKDLSQILIETANQEQCMEHKVLSIWGLCCLAFEELNVKPNDSLVKEIIRVLLPLTTHNDQLVTRAALDALSTLALLFEEFRRLDESIIFLIVDVLCSNVLRLLLDAKNKGGALREQLIADHYYCLNDWLMTCSTIIFDKRALVCKLFESIEIGLLGQKLGGGGGGAMESSKPAPPPKPRSNRMTVQLSPATELLDTLRSKPLHGSDLVKESSQVLLIQLCNFLQNFPSKEGVEIMSSHVTEEDDIYENVKPMFYIYNDFALFSLTEIQLDESTYLARLILRDCTGKYAWDSKINYDNNTYSAPPPYSLLSKPIIPPTSPSAPLSSNSDRAMGYPPRNPNADGPPVDQLDDLLQFLGEKHKDCLLESGSKLNEPAALSGEFISYINKVQQSIITQYNADNEFITTLEHKPYETWALLPPDPPQPVSPLHHCRLFLSHLGFLAYEKQHYFSMVEDSQRFQRSLTQLDKTSGREMLKIGLIYVKYGQDDQKIIMQNDSKSELFAEFVRGLGWTIDIPSHKGYLGGLDPKLTTGVTAPYYANSIMEVVFHDISAMPTNHSSSDDQQIHKKRHVGNDIVHIVYSEHCCDYNPSTITSQFNDAHIIVYPLPNGLFRIQVYRKENVQLFGPLLHGMCVNKRILPALVRQTAINANRYVRYKTEGYCRPFPTRRKALDEIVERFKVRRPYEDFIGEVMSPSKPANNNNQQ